MTRMSCTKCGHGRVDHNPWLRRIGDNDADQPDLFPVRDRICGTCASGDLTARCS